MVRLEKSRGSDMIVTRPCDQLRRLGVVPRFSSERMLLRSRGRSTAVGRHDSEPSRSSDTELAS